MKSSQYYLLKVKNKYYVVGLNFTSFLVWVIGTIFRKPLHTICYKLYNKYYNMDIYGFLIRLLVPAEKRENKVL